MRRGGYYRKSLLPHLDFALFREKPKILVGASNPTVLLNAITAVSSVATFHGPSVIWDFGDPDQPRTTKNAFRAVLCDHKSQLGNVPTMLRAGSATGPLLGGNLTSLLHLAGTQWMPDFRSAILIWEDIGDDTAHLACKLTQLAEIGVLDHLAGMIVGELVDCEPSGGIDAATMVLDVCARFTFPIAFGLPFGHTPKKAVLPLGIPVHLADDGALEIAGPAVDDRPTRAVGRAIVIESSLAIELPQTWRNRLLSRRVHRLDGLDDVTVLEYSVEPRTEGQVAIELAERLRAPGFYAHIIGGDSMIVASEHDLSLTKK